MKRKLLLIVLAALMVIPGLTVGAQSITEMQQQQQEIQREAEGTRQELTETQQEMEALEAAIMAMDMVLDEATERLEEIDQYLAETEIALAETEQALEEAQQERDEHFERFRARLRETYILGPVVYLEVVLQATSFSNFLTRLDHMNTIARSDREMAGRLQVAESIVAEKLEETYIQMARIETLQAVQEERIMELEDALDQKYMFMSLLEYDVYQYEAKIRELEQANQEITTQIQRLQAEEEARRRAAAAQEAARRAAQQTVRPLGGSMTWPVPGHYRVSSGYGNRQHPISRRSEFHTGIDIPAPNGTYILAAYGGTVIISGWQRGYGHTIVIDHGGGISTLYGHNSRNIVEVGQEVTRGQRIARVGSTGISTGPHLHFEVRHNGRHVSPNSYLGI